MSQTCTSCGGSGRKITKTCKACNGRGKTLQTDTIKAKIPAGVDTGSIVKLKGMGGKGEAGGPPGDLRIEMTVRPHPIFTRKENDIYVDLPITFGEAALGAKIEVPTIDGSAVMTIPAGTQGGRSLSFPERVFLRRGQQGGAINMLLPK